MARSRLLAFPRHWKGVSGRSMHAVLDLERDDFGL
jgi:hypothetical protein